MSKPLDILSFPLSGLRLIEASAGTGKPAPLPGCICVCCWGMVRVRPGLARRYWLIVFWW